MADEGKNRMLGTYWDKGVHPDTILSQNRNNGFVHQEIPWQQASPQYAISQD
jgi:hypothetical protein